MEKLKGVVKGKNFLPPPLNERKPLEIPWPGGREVYNYREEPVGKCCATFSLDLGGE